MADIFLSYKKEDRVIAEPLVTALRKAGKSVWWDDALNPQQAWDAMIEREIAAAVYVVVLWTPRSVTSDWVRSEAHYAQDHHKLVPVTIEHCSLPLAFMLRQSVDLSTGVFDDSNPQWDKLLGWLEGEHPEVAPGRGDAGARCHSGGGGTVEGAVGRGLVASRQATDVRNGVWRDGDCAAGRAVPVPRRPRPRQACPARCRGRSLHRARRRNCARVCGIAVERDVQRLFDLVADQPGQWRRQAPTPRLSTDQRRFDRGRPDTRHRQAVRARYRGPGQHDQVRPAQEQPDRGTPVRAATGRVHPAVSPPPATAPGRSWSSCPPEAITPWARYCQQINSDTDSTSSEAIVATLRNVVAAAPDFANGWSNLSENLLFTSFTPGANKAAILADTAKAAERALAIDPTTAKAYEVQAWLAVGLWGDGKSGSSLPHFHNFAEWEKLAEKSISVRPSDCGCELPNYSFTLTALGRPSAGLPLLQQAVGNDPNNAEHFVTLASATAATGNAAGGLKMLDDLAVKWPGNKSIKTARFGQALWRHDWPAARTALADQPESPVKAAWPALLDALQGGDAARIHAAGAPFMALSSDPANSGSAITALAMSGNLDEAVDAITAALERGDNVLSLMFRPSFAEACKTAKFAALAQRTGLIDYWKIHRPDFCGEPSPATVCGSLAKS